MNNYEAFKSIRKPIAPPTKFFDSKKEINPNLVIKEGLEEYNAESDDYETIELDLTEEELNILTKAAEAKNMSLDEFLNFCLEEFFKNQK